MKYRVVVGGLNDQKTAHTIASRQHMGPGVTVRVEEDAPIPDTNAVIVAAVEKINVLLLEKELPSDYQQGWDDALRCARDGVSRLEEYGYLPDKENTRATSRGSSS